MFGDPVKNPKGWHKVKLGQLSEIRRGASPRPIDKFLGGIVPWIKIGDGTKGNEIYIEETAEKVTKEGAKKSVLLKEGSLIFANCGVSLGFARILKIKGCIHDGWLALENISNELNKIFLLKLINALTYYFQSIAPEGTQPNLNTGIMKNFDVILPPLSLQQQFAEIVNKAEALKEKQKQSAQELENLFQSLMQKAFKGELKFSAPVYIFPSLKEKGLSSTDLHACIIAKIIKAHSASSRYSNTLGHVKTEKICHIIENHVELNLGRDPKRIAAGPADFPHLQKVEHRAKMKNWFTVQKRENEIGYKYKPGKSFDNLLKEASKELSENEKSIDEIINIFVNLKTEHAEIIATVYAAWNDLLLDGKTPSDNEIVTEARENWTPEKKLIEKEKFYKSIEWLKRKNLIPIGRGKHTIKAI